MRFFEGFLLACDTCLGHRASRKPYLVLGGLVAMAALWWCVLQALVAPSVRRWAVAGAAGFVIVLLAIASVTVVPVVGQPGVSCDSAVNATAMRHFGPRSYWDVSGCDAAGWRRIHQAQAVGSVGIIIGAVSVINTWRGLRARQTPLSNSAVSAPST